ncbi:MAG: aminotransferase class IV family protein [Saprospiraceae bacterium]|nr:aminotransferase class IV family protein [Saprospiraceae bacterium]
MSLYTYLNGHIIHDSEANIHVSDLGLLRGYGVFDFFRAIEGQPIFMDDHLDRFERSASFLGLRIPVSRQHIKDNILELIDLNHHTLLGIRLICTGGYSEDSYAPAITPNLVMLAKPFTFHPVYKGLKLMTEHHQRDMPTVKTTNYIHPISLLPLMHEIKADDVLYHFNGYISESSRSNICIIKDGILITPSQGILEGITRKKILNFAHEILPVEIRMVTLKETLKADEVFLCGSTKRISPVTSIDNQTYEIGPLTKILYERLIKEEHVA